MFDDYDYSLEPYEDDLETWERDQLAMDQEDWDEYEDYEDYEDYDDDYGHVDYPEDY
jgi:hypothetical protein